MTIFLGPFLDTFVEIGATLALWRAARRSSSYVVRTDATYTMAFFSGIIDFQKWAVINVPGQGSIGLGTFFGSQVLVKSVLPSQLPAILRSVCMYTHMHSQAERRFFILVSATRAMCEC